MKAAGETSRNASKVIASWSARTLSVLALLQAVATIALVLLLPKSDRPVAFAILLAAIGAVYLGFAFIDGRWRVLVLEATFFYLIFALAFLGALVAPIWLAVGYFAHGPWHVIHHSRARLVATEAVPDWYAFALVYDWVVAIYILVWLT